MRHRILALLFLAALSAGPLHAQIVDVESGGQNVFRDRTSLAAVTRVHEGDTVVFAWPTPSGRNHNVFPFDSTLRNSGTLSVPASDVMTRPSSTSGTFTSAWDPVTRSRGYRCTLHSGMNGVIYVHERAQAFAVEVPAEVMAGRPFSLTVRAVGDAGTTDALFTGAVHLSSGEADPGQQLPADHAFTPGDAGSYRFDGLVLTVTGPRTIDITEVGGSGITTRIELDVSACRSQVVYVNPVPILVPDPRLGSPATAGFALPYPAVIDVRNVTAAVTGVTVTLFHTQHQRRQDMDVLLVGPGGQAFTLLSDVAGSVLGPGGAPGVALTLVLTDTPPLGGGDPFRLRPINNGAGDLFLPPAPPPPYLNPAPAGTATLNSTFAGRNPNGRWSLYVYDDLAQATGAISGWSLTLDLECP
jgi:plastocyanin